MKREQQTRLSLIDGAVESAVESVELTGNNQSGTELEPLFEEIIEYVLTLEGPEQIIQKRIVGFRKKEA